MQSWKPDLVVLDEAQRIKNWAAKTSLYVKSLEPPLEEYQRLRVGPYRILFRHAGDRVRCVFAERRGLVYEVFSEILLKGP